MQGRYRYDSGMMMRVVDLGPGNNNTLRLRDGSADAAASFLKLVHCTDLI